MIRNIELNESYKYVELCNIFGEERKTGKSKQLQIKKWERCYELKKGEKATFIIGEIYNNPKEKIDNRGKSKGSRNNYKGKHFDNFLVSKENKNNIGVYSIVLNNDIYIGSTIVGFRERFLEHIEKTNPLKTKEMLEQGGSFKIIKICNGMTEKEIRILENEYINLYKNDIDWNLINTNNAWSYEKHTKTEKRYYITEENNLAISLKFLGFEYVFETNEDSDIYKFEDSKKLKRAINKLLNLKKTFMKE